MSPLEIMAKAEHERLPGSTPWAQLPEHSRQENIEDMRAAVLALAEADLSELMINIGVESDDFAPRFDSRFRALLHEIAISV